MASYTFASSLSSYTFTLATGSKKAMTVVQGGKTVAVVSEGDTVAFSDVPKSLVRLGTNGNDTVTIDSNQTLYFGGSGSDTVTLLGNACVIDGGDGIDTFKISDSFTLEDASFTLTSNGSVPMFSLGPSGNAGRLRNVEYVTDGDGAHAVMTAGGVTKGTGLTDYAFIDAQQATFSNLDGNGGRDRLYFAGGLMSFSVDLTKGSYSLGSPQATAQAKGFTDVYALSGMISVAGNASANVISGADLFDTLFGGAGADTIYGNGGNDTINGGDDDDRLFGGSLLQTDVAAGDNSVDGGSGNDTLYGGGGTSNDTLLGGAGNDVLYDFGGNGSLSGGDGDDWLGIMAGSSGTAFVGSATLDGGAGNDSLFGGPGSDTLRGGAGIDQLTGGDGADRFVITYGDSNYAGANGDPKNADQILDFQPGKDLIDLTSIRNNGVLQFEGKSLNKGTAGVAYETVGPPNGPSVGIVVHVDWNKDGVGDMDIWIKGLSKIDASSFLF